MAADFTQDSVLHFLQSSGGSAKNSDLLQHFRFFLRDHVDRDRNRELFKRFVNSVATVKQEDGSSHVVLRRRFRGHVPGGTGGTGGTGDVSLPGEKPQREAPPARRRVGGAAGKTILPAAGIIVNNNNHQPEPEISSNGREAPAAPLGVQQRAGPQSSAPAQVSQPVTPRLRGRGLQPEGGLHQNPPQTYSARHRPSYRAAVSRDDEDEVPVSGGMTGGTWPPSGPSGGAVPSSSPQSMVERPAPPPGSSPSSERNTPKIYIQSVEGAGSRWDPEHVQGRSEPSHSSPSLGGHRAQLHQGVQQQQLVPGGGRGQRAWLSSSHSSISSLSSEVGFFSSDWPPRDPHLGPQRVSSCEALQVAAGDSRGRSQAQEVLLNRPESPAPVSLLRHSSDHLHDDRLSAPRVLSWHRSTGDLYDSSEDSTSSPPPPQHRVASRRLSSKLRSRMCRSLGADLDQLLREEATAAGGGTRGHDAARLNRLHRISSSLSLHHNLSSSSLSSCSTPPRCRSLADLAEGMNGRGRRGGGGAAVSPTSHQESPSRQSLVPLEPREHVWLVKGAAGAWPDVYALFREDATLLNRRDFISGFTVLHWIAKHGDHRVLNTLWYGVQKAGLTFDVNSRSTCGHTPLHIAAIHNNKNVMRLLVNKFAADVKLRDTAGKRPWQYLSPHAPQDILQMLGAPLQTRGDGATADDLRQQHHHHHRRRRRHHLSSVSSGERPLTVSGKVKRSSSFAAFLKPLQRFPGHQSDDQSV